MTTTADDRDSEILLARARALARPTSQDTEQDRRELLVATLGASRLAVDVQRVRQVLPPAPLARIPAGNHFIVGLRNVSGELLAVADITTLLGLTSGTALDMRWVVVLDGRGGSLGILVDSVDELAADAANPAPSEPAPAGVATTGLLSGATAAGHLLIDTDALLAHPSLRVEPVRAQETISEKEPA